MMTKHMKRIMLWLVVFAVAGMIFFFSSMDGSESMKMSNVFTDWFVRLFHPDYDTLPHEKQQEIYSLFVFIVRKAAHFTEFAAFGASLILLIHEYQLSRTVLWAWGIGTLYAVTDELHQLLIGTRTPSLRDVCIDSAGVLFGTLAIMFVFFCIERIRNKRTAG